MRPLSGLTTFMVVGICFCVGDDDNQAKAMAKILIEL
jgi:uncharacterized metal-binding protein